MLQEQKLTRGTLAAAAGSSGWLPLETVLRNPVLPTKLRGRVPVPPSSRALPQMSWLRGTKGLITLVALLLLIGYGAWHFGSHKDGRSGAAQVKATPHPKAPWYLLGYFEGQKEAKIAEAFGMTASPEKSEVAYFLKTLGVASPEPEDFSFCVQGYQDAVAGRSYRYLLPGPKDKMSSAPLPDALRNLFSFPVNPG